MLFCKIRESCRKADRKSPRGRVMRTFSFATELEITKKKHAVAIKVFRIFVWRTSVGSSTRKRKREINVANHSPNF